MAYATNPVDLNTGSEGIVLDPEMSREVWNITTEESAVMRLARRMELPGNGVNIPLVTSNMTVDVVGETAEKHVSQPGLGNKTVTPIKLAGIIPFSNEFRRDLPRVYDTIVRNAPAAIAEKFDRLVFNSAAPSTGFDVLSDATAISLGSTPYDALVSAKSAVAAGDGMLNGWVLSPQAEGVLLTAKDGDLRPIFINNAISDGSITRLLGEQAIFTRHLYQAGDPALLGVAGDWSKAHYGIVEGIKVRFSDQATINDGEQQINLWQRNMFALLVECTVSFAVEDKAAFVRLTA